MPYSNNSPYIENHMHIVKNGLISNMAKCTFWSLSLARDFSRVNKTLIPMTIRGIASMWGYRGVYKNLNQFKLAVKDIVEFGIITIYSNLTMTSKIDSLGFDDNFYIEFNDKYVESPDFINQFKHLDGWESRIDWDYLRSQTITFSKLFRKDLFSIMSMDIAPNQRIDCAVAFVTMMFNAVQADKSQRISIVNNNSIIICTDIVDGRTIKNCTKALVSAGIMAKITSIKFYDEGPRSTNFYARYSDRRNLLPMARDRGGVILKPKSCGGQPIKRHALDNDEDLLELLMSSGIYEKDAV